MWYGIFGNLLTSINQFINGRKHVFFLFYASKYCFWYNKIGEAYIPDSGGCFGTFFVNMLKGAKTTLVFENLYIHTELLWIFFLRFELIYVMIFTIPDRGSNWPKVIPNCFFTLAKYLSQFFWPKITNKWFYNDQQHIFNAICKHECRQIGNLKIPQLCDFIATQKFIF